jgi:hypothetical protein
MTEKTTDSAGKGEARRRLLRGTFAMPAVMTLVSGSALAAGSLTCVARQNASPVSSTDVPDASVLVRVPVWEKRNNQRFARFVSSGDIASLMPPGGSYLADDTWQCIQNTLNGNPNPPFTQNLIYTTNQVDTIRPNLVKAKVPNLYVAVRVDTAGKVVGVEPLSLANSAMYVSCWTSFGGAKPFNI